MDNSLKQLVRDTARPATVSTLHASRLTRYAKGFSLAEAMIASVILGFAAAGMVLPFSSGARIRAEGGRRTIAAALATDLIEQIVSAPADEVVATYGSYTESAGSVIRDFSTSAVFTDPVYGPFRRSASCAYVYVTHQDGAAAPNFIVATVNVYYSDVEMASVTRLITQ